MHQGGAKECLQTMSYCWACQPCSNSLKHARHPAQGCNLLPLRELPTLLIIPTSIPSHNFIGLIQDPQQGCASGLALELHADHPAPGSRRNAVGLQKGVDRVPQAALPLAAVVALACDDVQLGHGPWGKAVAVQLLQPGDKALFISLSA